MKIFNVIICMGVFTASIQATPAWLTHYLPNTFAARTAVVSFSIGTKGYIGTGTKQISGVDTDYPDFWEYNSLNDTWTQKANFANSSTGRKNAVGFAIGTKGYVGTGGNGGGNALTDFWEFDPSGNTWTSKTAFPGVISSVGVAFVIGTKGYVRSGDVPSMANRTSFYEFDPSGNTWTAKTDLGTGVTGIVRRSAVAFSINGKGYLGTGLDASSFPQKDIYEFDPAGNSGAGSWTQKADFSTENNDKRSNAVAFATSTKGYIGLGYDTGVPKRRSFWEYNPTANSGAGGWAQILDYPIANDEKSRAQAFGFIIGDNLYVGTGNWGAGAEEYYYNDFYIYAPSGAHVLPVELTTITATADMPNEQVNVNWQTATEAQSAYFAIERQSNKNHQFEEIGRVKGAGNSSKTLIYKFIDEKPLYGVSYYRLRLADIDGKTTYSKAVSVSYKGGAKIKVFPTFTDGYISIENGDTRIDDVYVWNASGQLMVQSKQKQLDLSDLPRGLYLVQVRTGEETFVQKITKR